MMVAVLVLVTSCTRAFTVKTHVSLPSPLIVAQPAQVALILPDVTRNHHYKENTVYRPNWSILTGPSHVALWQKMFTSMFTSVQMFDSETAVNGQFDTLVTPRLNDMQFSLPSETGLGHYEVWMSYEITMKTSSGEPIVQFPLTGYGKVPSEFLTTHEEGLQAATNDAFRDIASKLLIELPSHPQVQKWFAASTSSG
jgi:hypothetical protein